MAGTRRSIQELSAEVATNPHSTAFVELAAAYRERGDLSRAARLCLRGLERHPTHVEAHFELGRIYEARGERELALDEWTIVRQLAPDHLPAICASARLYLEEGRVEDARRDFNEALTLAPEDPAVHKLRDRMESATTMAGNGVGTGTGTGARAGARAGAGAEAIPKGARREVRPARAAPEAGDDIGGAQGLLVVDVKGQVKAGKVKGASPKQAAGLASAFSSARPEAERVAGYLELGGWHGMVVEAAHARLSISPLGDGVLIVMTDPKMPAGRAVRITQRARERAEARLGIEGT